MRTKPTRLTAAQVAAFHEQLRLEDVRAEILRAKCAAIIERAKVARAAKRETVFADAYARAQARHVTRQAIRKAIRPIQLPLPLEKIA